MKQSHAPSANRPLFASFLSVSLGAAYLLLTALVLNLSFCLPESQAEEQKSPVVVELFTSQGCSSCPPADELLGELRHEEGLIALALHVDYWDYIGWKDPFADPAYTARQQEYAHFQNKRRVYTPQMIINGTTDVVGSRRRAVTQAIHKARLEVPQTRVSLDESQAVISAADVGQRMVEIWVFAFDSLHKTDVNAGENRGRVLADYNVVREMKKLGYWKGEATELPLNLASYKKMGRAGVAVVVQEAKGGPILGAAQLMF
ncbi:DUF1223 domain-containing protein [Rhodovibrionaceae bacterium A322]